MTRDEAMALVNEYVKHALDIHDDGILMDEEEFFDAEQKRDAAWERLIDALTTHTPGGG